VLVMTSHAFRTLVDVIGCSLTQDARVQNACPLTLETRFKNACDDAPSTIHLSLALGVEILGPEQRARLDVDVSRHLARALVDAAIERGTRDNVTCVVCLVGGGGGAIK